MFQLLYFMFICVYNNCWENLFMYEIYESDLKMVKIQSNIRVGI